MGLNMILPLVGGLAVFAVLVSVVLVKKRTAYLGPVKEELQKEKLWLRRGEYNAAMVKGRQNLELLLKLVAEKNGIQLDNTAQAVANAREEEERQSQQKVGRHGGRKKEKKVMTHQQFNRWLAENGYLDRVAKWEMQQVRLIGNKAVHENYADKDDAWNQYNYLEDILKTVTEKSQNPKKHHERKGADKPVEKDEKRQEGQKRQNKRKAQGEKKPQSEKKRQNSQKNEKNVPAAEAPAETEAQEQEHRKRRRRRKKKPQAEGAIAEQSVKVQTAEKPAEKPLEKLVEKPVEKPAVQVSEESVEVKKKRRRRRRRKPQTKAAEGAAGTAIVPEDKNESI